MTQPKSTSRSDGADLRRRHARLRLHRYPAARAAQSYAKTIDLFYDIEEAPRVYVERINIVGNTRTRDDVIRANFALPKAMRSIACLQTVAHAHSRSGFFKDVTIKEDPARRPIARY